MIWVAVMKMIPMKWFYEYDNPYEMGLCNEYVPYEMG